MTMRSGFAPVLQLWFGDAPEGAGGHLASVELAGFAPIGETPIVDGRATIGLAPRSGGVLRVV